MEICQWKPIIIHESIILIFHLQLYDSLQQYDGDRAGVGILFFLISFFLSNSLTHYLKCQF